jgi:predicted site-specific integrase-resolvase
LGVSLACAAPSTTRRWSNASSPTSGDGLLDDFLVVITSLAARLCGRRNAKRRAAQIQACVKQGIEQGIERAD